MLVDRRLQVLHKRVAELPEQLLLFLADNWRPLVKVHIEVDAQHIRLDAILAQLARLGVRRVDLLAAEDLKNAGLRQLISRLHMLAAGQCVP